MISGQVLLQAIAFGFGPASQATAIASQLRNYQQGRPGLEIIGLGHSVAFEFLKDSGEFDRVLEWDSRKGKLPGPIRQIVHTAQAVLSVGDFDFALAAQKTGRKVAFVDALYWMWDQDPIDAARCAPYYAVDFPGVAKRIGALYPEWAEKGNPQIINPICLPFQEDRNINDSRDHTVIINFGGLVTPFGVNLNAAKAMTKEILSVLSDQCPGCRVLVTGGSPVIGQLGESALASCLDVRVGPLPAPDFLLELVQSRFIFTVPSISISLEIVATGLPAFFLLPLNYSQHLQQTIFREILHGAGYAAWDDFDGYKSLPQGVPEQEGVAGALDLGERFSKDPAARAQFRDSVVEYVKHCSKDPVRLVKWVDRSPGISMNGAREIATDIVNRTHIDRAEVCHD